MKTMRSIIAFVIAAAAATAFCQLEQAPKSPAPAAPTQMQIPAALPAPREVSVSFEGIEKGSDLITIEHAKLVTIQAVITNTSDKAVKILGTSIGTGPTPVVITPADRTLAPGEKFKMPTTVNPGFAPYPIPVGVGVVYGLDGDEHMRFAVGRARVAPKDAVIPAVNLVTWRGDDEDERQIQVNVPNGVALKNVVVRGEFTARVENNSIFVKPNPPKDNDVSDAPVAKVPLPPGATIVPDPNAARGRKTLANGTLQLVLDPEPSYRVAAISLQAQPRLRVEGVPAAPAPAPLRN